MFDGSPLKVAKHLRVSEKFAKINVEHVARLLEHDVVIVTVTNTQNISGNTITGT